DQEPGGAGRPLQGRPDVGHRGQPGRRPADGFPPAEALRPHATALELRPGAAQDRREDVSGAWGATPRRCRRRRRPGRYGSGARATSTGRLEPPADISEKSRAVPVANRPTTAACDPADSALVADGNAHR